MIYIEKTALGLPLAQMVALEREVEVIEDGTIIEDKKSNIVITSGKDNFCHPCPGTNIYRCCNYHVVDIMQGCPFDCAYCILQAYLPHKHIRVTADMELVRSDILKSVELGKRRIGTGELADSLALDNIIPLSKFLIPIAAMGDNIQFEFKTKSDNISNLLDMEPKNVVVSWSLNPQEIIDKEEPLTASLDRRLKAAADCVKHGYRVGFHFDPLIMVDNFQTIYGNLIDKLTEAIPGESVEFISISTFRCPQELLDSIRRRRNSSILTKGDFIKGIDGKVRYFKAVRMPMMRFVTEKLKKAWKGVFIYYCMEHERTWEQLQGIDPGSREDFEKLFPFYSHH